MIIHRLSLAGQRMVCAALLALALGGAPSTPADTHQPLHGEVRRGELVPLEQILDWLEAHYLGEVLEVELERDDGAVLYEIKMIGPQGQIVEFEFDAHSGQLMAMEGVNINAMQREGQ
ncbi:PepSY domain-containing protein [Franzmannia qiaohouensis]|uniref:PepSY domain-containing protein n=1 Tax=Franzmannia qiaohouensis TaxID=1329370 RepID=A0ABU1HBC8_9GAMM|nr:PepSY domain-containing protein [Halomonas qiaohouensis]MDR5904174.1 PepSY domain-containing protein [Halomonas qiaohouensis]